MQVNFYDKANDSLLKFVVIIATHNGQYVLCKHKDRNTLEIPGGHREPDETINDAAKRELQEETGAIKFTIKPVCVYSVTQTSISYGMLYFAEIQEFDNELHYEIEKIILTYNFPDNLTYPEIQPKLFAEAQRRGYISNK